LVRDLLYHYYWRKVPKYTKENSQIIEFRKSLTQLIRLLRDRQARKHICKPDCFLFKGLDGQVLHALQDEKNASYAKAQAIVTNIPFVLEFNTRVTIFQQKIRADKTLIGLTNPALLARGLRSHIPIRRDRVLQDGFERLNNLSLHAFKGAIQIRFIDKAGLNEAGVDGGGLFKEFIHLILQEACDSETMGLFVQNPDYCLYPNPFSMELSVMRGAKPNDALKLYEFIGQLLGKAMYDSILVDPRFANFFLRKLLGMQNYVDDLISYDETVYKNLMTLKHDKSLNIDELALTFSVASNFLETQEQDLMPGGRNIPVSKENVLQYINRLSHFRMNQQIKNQAHAFRKGFWSIIDRNWLCLFSPEEVNQLIGGSEDFNWRDLQMNIAYHSEYHANHVTIRWFWEVVEEMTAEERRELLKFATSCSRAPLLGFKALNPKFGIQLPHYDENSLPTASTCANLLKLPPYSSKELLRQKVMYAIKSKSGFGLT